MFEIFFNWDFSGIWEIIQSVSCSNIAQCLIGIIHLKKRGERYQKESHSHGWKINRKVMSQVQISLFEES